MPPSESIILDHHLILFKYPHTTLLKLQFLSFLQMEWCLDGRFLYMVLMLWINNSRLSANNCARLYNHALASSSAVMQNNPGAFSERITATSVPFTWQYSLEMSSEDALNGFFIYSLLLHHAEHRQILSLPHNISGMNNWLKPALARRNKAMEGFGQEYWSHACSLCFLVDKQSSGEFSKLFNII